MAVRERQRQIELKQLEAAREAAAASMPKGGPPKAKAKSGANKSGKAVTLKTAVAT